MSTSRYERNVFSQRRGDYYEHDERSYNAGPSSEVGGGGGGQRYPRSRGNYHSRQGGNYQAPRYNNSDGNWRGGRKGGPDGSVGRGNYHNRRYQRQNYNGGVGGGGQGQSEGRSRMQTIYDNTKGSRKHRYKIDNRNDKFKRNLGWCKIIIQDGASLNKEAVLKLIEEHVELPFTPIMFEPEGNHLVFYLENNGDVVDAIDKISRRLRMPDTNQKLFIRLNQSVPPFREFTPQQLEVILKVMSDKYSVQMQRLDLKNFHNNPELVKQNIFCTLSRKPNMERIAKLIIEHIKDIKEINLSFNKISSLEELKILVGNCPDLQQLSLEKNKLNYITSLDPIKGLNLRVLTLRDNPLCDKFNDTETLVSAVRQRFPRLTCLDGEDLPVPVIFELEEEQTTLPAVQGSFFCNEEAKNIISEFIVQYYQIYDSDDRSGLAAAYCEDATFSLSLSLPETGANARNASSYLQHNRNLVRIKDTDRRQEKLAKGRTRIMEVLAQLPNTTHDPASFVVDIPLAEPQLIKVVLTGLFKQPSSERYPVIRSFMRSFIIIPVGSGFCICNEMLFVTYATVEQVKRAFKPKPVEAAPPAPDALPPLTEEQMKLLEEMSKATGMLPKFSGMCLEQNNWDLTKASEMYMSLKAENKIPPEYYGQ